MTTFDELKTKIEKAIETRKAELKHAKDDVIATDNWESVRFQFERCCETEVEIFALQRALRFGPTAGDMIRHLVNDIMHEAAMARPQHSINGRLAAMRTIEAMVNE